MPYRSNKAKKLFRVVLLLAVLLFGNVQAAERGQVANPNDVKAFYIFHFTKFVTFPKERFNSDETPLVIGVFGKHEILDNLVQIARGKTAKSRRIKVVKVDSLEEAKKTHLLYFPEKSGRKGAQMLSGLKGAAILTISEADGSAGKAGMIYFVIEGKHVRFRGNLERIKEEKIKVASKLIQLMR